MKTSVKFFSIITFAFLCGIFLTAFLSGQRLAKKQYSFPYQQAGLTDRQAAAHLLNRFTFGATPGQVDAVVKMGLENWFAQQLNASQPNDSLNAVLGRFDDLKLSNEQVVAEFPKPGQILRMGIKDGVINKDSVNNIVNNAQNGNGNKAYREQLKAYMDKKGLKPLQELYRQFFNEKVLLATYSQNQLQEVMTDFWFNHFNVSLTKNDCAQFIPAYERDVIRPNALGKFDDLLLATAKSPAMLYYLDNFSSVGANSQFIKNAGRFAQNNNIMAGDTSQRAKYIKQAQNARKAAGLNENYAREVMELHTLGVDGGYTQTDVTQAAKVLTGWTVFPMKGDGAGGEQGLKLIERYGGEAGLKNYGFVHDGDFFFAANKHDVGEKTVLGYHFDGTGGYQEGVTLLNMLAHHPSTAKFISKKIAVRFVSDAPPQTLLNKMAKTFTEQDGDIKQVLITMVSSPEFWSADAVRAKTKSPFELAISSLRALNARVNQPFQIYNWVAKMGQRMYYYQAPTGFPDKGQYWINTGSLLNRMNFGIALASQRIPGVQIDLAALNNNHEPESAVAALPIYGKLVMPERNLTQTIKQLTPVVTDPNLATKLDAAAGKTPAPTMSNVANPDMEMASNDNMEANSNLKPAKIKGNKKGQDPYNAMQQLPGVNNMLSQVVGILIGSPEFQRR